MSVFEAIRHSPEWNSEVNEATKHPPETTKEVMEQPLLSKMELKDIPNCANAITHGNPFELSKTMDHQQGDTDLHIRGNCGIGSAGTYPRC